MTDHSVGSGRSRRRSPAARTSSRMPRDGRGLDDGRIVLAEVRQDAGGDRPRANATGRSSRGRIDRRRHRLRARGHRLDASRPTSSSARHASRRRTAAALLRLTAASATASCRRTADRRDTRPARTRRSSERWSAAARRSRSRSMARNESSARACRPPTIPRVARCQRRWSSGIASRESTPHRSAPASSARRAAMTMIQTNSVSMSSLRVRCRGPHHGPPVASSIGPQPVDSMRPEPRHRAMDTSSHPYLSEPVWFVSPPSRNRAASRLTPTTDTFEPRLRVMMGKRHSGTTATLPPRLQRVRSTRR